MIPESTYRKMQDYAMKKTNKKRKQLVGSQLHSFEVMIKNALIAGYEMALEDVKLTNNVKEIDNQKVSTDSNSKDL